MLTIALLIAFIIKVKIWFIYIDFTLFVNPRFYFTVIKIKEEIKQIDFHAYSGRFNFTYSLDK
ncbi:hypothetical protein ASL19_13565 [Cylindrospermopsis sp. CR12]|nr:hypothetical protein ASL19_13565 [Cylindrospermopsis sp. CR12]